MQVCTLLAIAVILVASTESKPTWHDLYLSNYQYPSTAINVQPHLLHYQDTYSPYYVYNDVNAIPTTLVASHKPTVPHLPAYSFYYGTPVYDLRVPLGPLYPALKPSKPCSDPKPPTSTTETTEMKDDGVEKLDTKIESEKKMKKPSDTKDNDDDDSITVESI
ncbi:uncharacterized protein LOC122399832 isoform X2 [Colletes gigas]|uniref:uncharacterized protein LOC122399832 isoform X2 n=1 Tax=Colletes gigas TaxID=935657 RepID=UPI001C9A596E|nr:uncharacterized protein LOC122399832 isoform X2 [Colletes gigas]